VTAALTDSAPGERLKIAIIADPPGGATDPGIVASIRSVGDHLANAGHDVVEATPPSYERAIEMWTAILMADLRVQSDLLQMVMGPDALKMIAEFDAQTPVIDLSDALNIHGERYGLMKTWSEFHQEFPILLSPTWTQPAFTHGADIDPDSGLDLTDTIRPVIHSNLLGTPSAITPAGISNGLPVGVQVMGDRFTDLRCLTVAAEIESLRVIGGVRPE